LKDDPNYPLSDLRYWEIGIDDGGMEFHLFIEKMNTLYSGSGFLIFLGQIILFTIFIPFLSMRWKPRTFLNNLDIFDHHEFLLGICDYLLIQRYKCSEESLKE